MVGIEIAAETMLVAFDGSVLVGFDGHVIGLHISSWCPGGH